MRQSRSSTTRMTAWVGLALLGPLTGCGAAIVGQWHMVQAEPNRDVFAIDEASFHKDGSFAATITIEGKTAREVGRYRFDGFKLTLRPAAGGQRSYKALLKFNKLEVSGSGRRVVLQRGRQPGPGAQRREGSPR